VEDREAGQEHKDILEVIKKTKVQRDYRSKTSVVIERVEHFKANYPESFNAVSCELLDAAVSHRPALAMALIRMGVDPNNKGKSVTTIVERAIMREKRSLACFLIRNGAEFTSIDDLRPAVGAILDFSDGCNPGFKSMLAKARTEWEAKELRKVMGKPKKKRHIARI